ncbi:MAG: cupin domain-containing protein [Opitutales bacterium]|jgi:uncharacterized cupin superfamily protein
MKKVNLKDVPESERKSPKRKFEAYSKEVSVALGRVDGATDLNLRHPFDLTVARLPAGAARCPYHAHSAQWELYLIISGRGKVRDAGGWTEVGPGDAFVFKPMEAHQIVAAADTELVYQVIADNPVREWCQYPDSGKFIFREEPKNTVVRVQGVDYFEGEE